VHALFGPAQKDGALLYSRSRLDGHGMPSEIELAPPEAAVDAWGIGSDADGPLFVLARSGTDLLVALPGRPGWTRVAEVAQGTSHLRVIQGHPGEIWAEWFDPQAGLRHAQIH
jgi:hypothetical protein